METMFPTVPEACNALGIGRASAPKKTALTEAVTSARAIVQPTTLEVEGKTMQALPYCHRVYHARFSHGRIYHNQFELAAHGNKPALAVWAENDCHSTGGLSDENHR
jgi:hypothetical protein